MLAWQVALVRDLGCERIVCLCNPNLPEIVRVQRDIEKSGAEFHGVRTPAQVAALMRDEDQVVAIADGLLIDPATAHDFMRTKDRLRKAVYTFAPDLDAPRGQDQVFERIDATRRWAGLLVSEGVAAQKLQGLPADGNVISLLLRVALQAQTPIIAAPSDALGDGRWLLVDSEDVAASREHALIQQAAPEHQWVAPLRMLAAMLARGMAGYILGTRVTPVILVAAVLLVTAVGLAYWDLVVAGLGVAALAVFVADFTAASARLNRAVRRDGIYSNKMDYPYVIVDILALGILLVILREGGFATLSLPVFAWLLARLAAVKSSRLLAPFWNDRAAHLAIFAICAVYGVLEEAFAAFGLLALVQVIARIGVWNSPGPIGSGTGR